MKAKDVLVRITILLGLAAALFSAQAPGAAGYAAPEQPQSAPPAAAKTERHTLAVSAILEDIDGVLNTGAVTVIPSQPGVGLGGTGSQFWHQDSAFVPGSNEENDLMGTTLAAGDFNGDGKGDLAIGIPREGQVVNSVNYPLAGRVLVMYSGSSGALSAANIQEWGAEDFAAGVQQDSSFGGALAVGNFNDDAYDDLVIGIPNRDIGLAVNAGSLIVIYGAAGGLSTSGALTISQDSPGFAELPGTDNLFGAALATGDFSGDGIDDLAIGVPGESVTTQASATYYGAGALHVVYGSAVGLNLATQQYLTQESPGAPTEPETDDQFAAALAAGDYDGDGIEDLAIGVPGEETVLYAVDHGEVHVFWGAAGALTSTGAQALFYEYPLDGYGTELASGDFNNDGYDDLALGMPSSELTGLEDSGHFGLRYGSGSGLGLETWFRQGFFGVPGVTEQGDFFGRALAVGDFDADGFDDLAVGAYGEELGSEPLAGAFILFYGAYPTLSSDGASIWTQGTTALPGDGDYEQDDFFAVAMAAIPYEHHWTYLPVVMAK